MKTKTGLTKSMGRKNIKDISEQLTDNVTIKGINELFNVSDGKIDLKTDLKDPEIKIILRLLFIAKTFNVRHLDNFITKYMRLRLSSGRKSRKEIIEMVKSDINNQIMGNQGGFMGKMRGMMPQR